MKTAGGVTYSYDGDGRRAAKVGSKLYWYGSGGEILAETNAAGATLNAYIFFGGRRVALVPASGSALYYAADLLGSSRVMVQSNGTLCYDADFTPFGAERTITNTCAQNSYKFEGKERDAETGNDDFGAREYSWRMGRWLSSDWSAVPVAVPYANLTNPQTLNLYAMVADDPESFADLDGHGEDSPGPTDKTQTCETVDGCAQSHAEQPVQEKIAVAGTVTTAPLQIDKTVVVEEAVESAAQKAGTFLVDAGETALGAIAFVLTAGVGQTATEDKDTVHTGTEKKDSAGPESAEPAAGGAGKGVKGGKKDRGGQGNIDQLEGVQGHVADTNKSSKGQYGAGSKKSEQNVDHRNKQYQKLQDAVEDHH